MTDAEALEAIKRGDNAGLDVLYRRHRSKCLRFAQRYLGGEAEPADLYQDAILVLYQNILSGRLTELGNTAAYLIQIMRNRWSGNVRRAARPLLTRPVAADDEEHADRVRQRLRRALAKVDERCRALLIFRHFDGLSYEDIVELTAYTSADAIRNGIVRCRKKLRELYEKEPDLPYQPDAEHEVAWLDGLTEEE